MNTIIFDFNRNDILGEDVIIQVSAISETKRQGGRDNI